jgi:hypothetical protein
MTFASLQSIPLSCFLSSTTSIQLEQISPPSSSSNQLHAQALTLLHSVLGMADRAHAFQRSTQYDLPLPVGPTTCMQLCMISQLVYVSWMCTLPVLLPRKLLSTPDQRVVMSYDQTPFPSGGDVLGLESDVYRSAETFIAVSAPFFI